MVHWNAQSRSEWGWDISTSLRLKWVRKMKRSSFLVKCKRPGTTVASDSRRLRPWGFDEYSKYPKNICPWILISTKTLNSVNVYLYLSQIKRWNVSKTISLDIEFNFSIMDNLVRVWVSQIQNLNFPEEVRLLHSHEWLWWLQPMKMPSFYD